MASIIYFYIFKNMESKTRIYGIIYNLLFTLCCCPINIKFNYIQYFKYKRIGWWNQNLPKEKITKDKLFFYTI